MEVLEAWVQEKWRRGASEFREWTAARCTNCLSPLTFKRFANEQKDVFPFDERVQVFPNPRTELSPAVPAALRTTFNEAQKCMQVGCYTAAAIMARRVVEGLANLNQAKGGTLAAKLKNLNAAGVLDARLLEWSDLIKDVGNEGAHETDSTMSREDSEEVMRFVEALLDYHYTYRVQYEAFVKRREERSAGKAVVVPPLDASQAEGGGEGQP
ncbi:DUF4145 domain-containing protein [Ornithinimicrobium panacihumi]|uniref:DUF4145 domain-containing protein n=1 Tax=Ornithinimicrobium panacihumi TaxID=2008449 RepID=UPI003F891EE2